MRLDLFPLKAALSGKAFTLVNHSIRFYKTFYLLAIFVVKGGHLVLKAKAVCLMILQHRKSVL